MSMKTRILRSQVVSMPDMSEIGETPLMSGFLDSSEQCIHKSECGLFEKGKL
jgi:hypothetical protein